MNDGEMMAILILYHLSGMKCFKYYYEQIICKVLASYWTKPYAYAAFAGRGGRPGACFEVGIIPHEHFWEFVLDTLVAQRKGNTLQAAG